MSSLHSPVSAVATVLVGWGTAQCAVCHWGARLWFSVPVGWQSCPSPSPRSLWHLLHLFSLTAREKKQLSPRSVSGRYGDSSSHQCSLFPAGHWGLPRHPFPSSYLYSRYSSCPTSSPENCFTAITSYHDGWRTWIIILPSAGNVNHSLHPLITMSLPVVESRR